MRKAGSMAVLLKRIGRDGCKGSGADPLSSGQWLEFRCSIPTQQHISSRAFFVGSTVYRQWLPTVYSNRSIHSSELARQNVEKIEKSDSSDTSDQIDNRLLPTTGGQKPRIVVLGTGWAGCRLMKDLNPNLYDIVCISPRNHMVFTPLLASTCVGTLEFRSVAEAVRDIQPSIAREPTSYFYLARCTSIDTEKRQVYCKAVGKDETAGMAASGEFAVAYDKLVIALGAQSVTFNTPGVYEHAIFLREVRDAQAIRSKLLLNLAVSDVPGVTDDEKRKILSCVVVGGGPTGVEFSGELSDFIYRDVVRKFSHVKGFMTVTLIEAKEILSSFDVSLRQYATKQLEQSGVKLVTGLVKEVHPGKLLLSDGSWVPYGLLVWSTGVGPSDFVKSLAFKKSPGGRIGIDNHLRVPDVEDVYAIGDCAGYLQSTGKPVLPALAQVAERQGKYLAKHLNYLAKKGGGHGGASSDTHFGKPFVYRHLGSMATVGHYKALVDIREDQTSKGLSISGFASWFIWRSAYLTRVASWRNRIYVATNWFTTFLFGRDISRF